MKHLFTEKYIRVTISKTDEVGLDFARKKAFSLLEKIQNGVSPNEEKHELSNEITLGGFYEEYMERHADRRNQKVPRRSPRPISCPR